MTTNNDPGVDIHYKYGGSTAARTLNCPGWQALKDELLRTGEIVKNDKGSPAASRGSLLHLACETLERDNLEFAELLPLGLEYDGIKLTQELIDTKVIPAMECLDDLADRYAFKTITPEEVIEYDYLTGGTIDITGEGLKSLVLADYKFGEGIMVYAEENDQLFFYAWIKLDKGNFEKPIEDFENVVLAIIQPADRKNPEDYLDVWETDVEAVMDFGERFLDAVDVAEAAKPGEHLADGAHCKFCPCEAKCPAKGKKAMQALALLNSSAFTKALRKDNNGEHTLKVMDLNVALKLAHDLEPWIKAVRKFAIEQLGLGMEDLNYKMVPKRVTRGWLDPELTHRYLKRKLGAINAATVTVLSPNQAELAGKAHKVELRLKSHIDKSSKGTTLVHISDPREAVVPQCKLDEAAADALAQLQTEAKGQLDLDLDNNSK